MNHTPSTLFLSITRILFLLSAFLMLNTAQAQAPAPLPYELPPPGPLDYYPLQDGNKWVYEVSDIFGDPAPPDRTVDCSIILETPNVLIARMENTYWGDLNVYQLQQDLGPTYPQGLMFAAADQGTAGSFLFPSLDEGTFFSNFEPACPDRPEQMRVYWKGTVTVPAGTFNRCVSVRLDCPIVADYYVDYVFAPDVGLIRYTISGLLGVIIREELLRATVNGVVYENFEENGVESRLVSNKHFFHDFDGGPNIDPLSNAHLLRAKFEIKNNDFATVFLGYPTSCQNPVFQIKNLAGAVLWTSDDNANCAQIVTERPLLPGTSEAFYVTANLLNLNGQPLGDGSYILSATTASTPAFTASLPFLVASPPLPIPGPGPLPVPVPEPPKD